MIVYTTKQFHELKGICNKLIRQKSGWQQRSAGGISDRKKGIYQTYLLSKECDVDFKIDWDIMRPYIFDKYHLSSDVYSEPHFYYNLMNQQLDGWYTSALLNDIKKKLFDGHKVILSINMYYGDYRAIQNMYSEIFRYNLPKSYAKPNTLIVDNPIMSLGVHFRLGGKNPSWMDPKMDELENVELLIEYIIYKYSDKYKYVYIASDSNDVKEMLKRRLDEYFSVHLTNEEIKHIDRSHDVKISDYDFVLAESYLLGQCDTILHGNGEFARISAFEHGKTPIHYANM